uniref:NADH dehydrogenase subunit 5 n=1 Tax=Brachypelma albiceps TaxID=1750704 RepID=UPI001FF6E02F|nr:NADH dehydrogenase subunit 5 [Brachypelma albiceps]UIO59249.1 NADH dehydrogenase subunit 5 [Brachypelma albiceps]
MFPSIFTLTLSMSLFFLSLILLSNDTMIQIFLPTFSFISIDFPMGFIFDWMSTSFSASVLLISSMIMIFSQSYIQKKDHKRFFLVLISFVLSMILMISSNNMFFMMLGWDGLGVSSYALVVFYMNSKSKESGAITILSNRIGDILIILSIGLSLTNGISEIFISKEFPFLIILLLMTAAMTKSAQYPFSSWLPAAMAAPTPISSLVHSSTLVTAGTYLLIRLMNLPHPNTMFILLILSSMTLFLSGMSANWEQDFKKIIALSTMSQMSMIMFAISINTPSTAYFHLITHAFFKSTMFLCAGAFIHCSSYQDIRAQGMFSNYSPSLILSFNITIMSLLGLPFMSGFYSKDSIIELFMNNSSNHFLLLLTILSVGMTTSYSLRLMSFSSKFSTKSNPDKSFSSDIFIIIPILCLIPCSIILGSSISWLTLPNQTMILPLQLKISIPFFLFLGFTFGLFLSFNKKMFLQLGETISSLWFLNFLSSFPFLNSSFTGELSSKIDKTWTESSSATGSFLLLQNLSKHPDMITNLSLCSLMLLIFIPSSFFL